VNDFEYDVKQKKDIARSAAHRVCGSKSTKCGLPSDHLTATQKQALNGPVVSVNLKSPMTWRSFKALPDHLQREYICYMKDTYGTSDRMLGDMFGVSEASVNIVRNRLGIASFGKGYMPTKATKLAWAEFIAPKTTETAAETDTTTEDVADAEIEPPTPCDPLRQFSVGFHDIRTWEELYAALKQFPAPGKDAHIAVSIERR
jgi:hypothetical protein